MKKKKNFKKVLLEMYICSIK